jgi:hypothetical protein
MISNQTISMVQSTVRAAGATSPGDKRRLFDAISAELGVAPTSATVSTDHVVPFREAALRLGMSPRTLSAEITGERIRAVRKILTGKKPRSVGIAASEINAYIRRQSEVQSA